MWPSLAAGILPLTDPTTSIRFTGEYIVCCFTSYGVGDLPVAAVGESQSLGFDVLRF